MKTLNLKFDIQREKQDLKIFFFTVQEGTVSVEFPEDFKVVMAYNDKDAINNIRKDYPIGLVIAARKRGEISVKKIFDSINFNIEVPQDMKMLVTPSMPQKKNVKDFVYGMMLIADKFIINKRDQASLKRIIKKIKIHEDQSNLATK